MAVFESRKNWLNRLYAALGRSNGSVDEKQLSSTTGACSVNTPKWVDIRTCIPHPFFPPSSRGRDRTRIPNTRSAFQPSPPPPRLKHHHDLPDSNPAAPFPPFPPVKSV